MAITAHSGIRINANRLARSGSRLGRMISLSVLVGLLAGLGARALESAIQFGQDRLIARVVDPGAANFFQFSWAILFYPMIGGLISGIIVGVFCKPTRAHGTAVLVDSFHHFGAELSLRDSALKTVAAICVISLGGSVGKEAVIAVLGAAIGSALATALKMSRPERRVFLIAGCAAGVGAIFKCPLGGAIFATTVLYREPEIEAGALMPSVIASVTSYSVFMAFGGYGIFLLKGIGTLTFTHPIELIAYAGLAFVCAGVAILFYYCLEGTIHFKKHFKLPRTITPAIAGLIVGLIACAIPQIMDARYQFLQNALDGKFLAEHTWAHWVLLFAAVMAAKSVATGAMIGAESAGGLFGPVLFIGGATGAAAGAFLEAFFPDTFPPTLRHALIPVAMAGVFSASLRTPLAAIVMITEMTGSYGLIVPLMLVTTLSYVLGRRWGVYPEQLAGPSQSPAHAGHSLVSMLGEWMAGELMDAKWPFVIHPGTRLAEMVAKVPGGSRPTFAVIKDGKLEGIVGTSDILRAAELKILPHVVRAVDIMTHQPVVLYPDDDLYGALGIFDRYNREVLPVVTKETGKFAGMLTRSSIYAAVRARLAEQRENVLREHAGFSALEKEARLVDMLGEFTDPQKKCIQRVGIPQELIGKSLRECDYRRNYGCQVIAIESGKGEMSSPPDPDRPLQKDDILIVLPMPD
jgi:CIC family chloride channel protein